MIASLWLAAALTAGASPPDPASPEGLLEAGHWKRLRAVVEPRLRVNPNDARAALLLSRVKLVGGDLDGALPLAEKLVALEPNNAEYHYQIGAIYGRKAQTAGFFSRFSLVSRFKREMETAVRLDPKQLDARSALVQFHLRAPGLLGGDKARALALADEMGRIDAARGYLAQAVIARADKQPERLEALYMKAVEADPGSYEALVSLASFYASDEQKKYDRAETYAGRAAKLDPHRSAAYSVLAVAAVEGGHPERLDAIVSESEAAVPDNLTPYYQAARVLLVKGQDLARAESYLRKYLTQEPEPSAPTHAHAWWRLGQVLEKEGRKDEAVAALQTAVKLKPDLPEPRKELARLK